MQIEKYLQNYQPVMYKTFVNALKTKKLSHAYLISGNPGTPLFDVATFLAKSILCDNPDPLCCGSCITCIRIDDNNYPDFIVLDGSKSTIKKGDVEEIENRFEKKAMESKGIMIYILHLVENMTPEALNSILKFLEEPECEIYAFLTTNNENNILPTIISRCQVLHLKQVNQQEVINSAINLGVSAEDAELLSNFYNDGELIFDFVNDKDSSEFYYKIKDALIHFLNVIVEEDNRDAIFDFQTNLIPLVKTKESGRYLIDMLVAVFKDLLKIQNGNDILLSSYATILNGVSNKLSNINESLVELLKLRTTINTNVNISSLFDHALFTIFKESLNE